MQSDFSNVPFATLLASLQEKENYIFEEKTSTCKNTSNLKMQNQDEQDFLQAIHKLENSQALAKSKPFYTLSELPYIKDFLRISDNASKNTQIKMSKASQKKHKKKALGTDKVNQAHSLTPCAKDASHDNLTDLTMQELLNMQQPGFMRKQEAYISNDADMQAFSKAMKEVQPLKGKGREIIPQVNSVVNIKQDHENFSKMMEKNIEFSLSYKGEYLEGHVLGLDELTMNNLRTGFYSPEAHLDLHGLNSLQAYNALIDFFRLSWYKGLRTVLLVPGRGKNSPNGFSVLRDKLQLWLTQDPFKRVILAFCTAQILHGGAGSVYVLLRKYKKKGKICWERLPADPDLY